MSTATLTLGLRFSRTAGRRLNDLADQLRSTRPAGIDVSLFDKAAESAEQDEPLVVRCSSRDEVEQMAQLFSDLGIERPAIDELNG